ncbi:hypothetical protein DYB28_001140 [Aphanomyces astaci]|uniref:Calcineurin-like phosphoesterase domain-containing protein n=1 Tax=Aphanomyces astaci TaxID=112090 RepID=A0A9X8E4B5_APHAT|nr:hypothetical protein DYB28_001140 [Aphanomyces astaci]
MKILYVTDVEGNWDYFLRFIQTVQTSPHTLNALTFTDASHTRLVLQRGYQFVFGGDVGDKGVVNTDRLIRVLLALKHDYPDRVVLIAGNRDVNKMRWTSEFTDGEMDLKTMDPGIKNGPHWLPETTRQSLGIIPYLSKLARNGQDVPITSTDSSSSINYTALDAVNTKKEAISDENVLDSFLESVQEGGDLRAYLKHCVLGAVLGSTLLVHGGIIMTANDGRVRSCLGRVPPADSTVSYAAWVAELDALHDEEDQVIEKVDIRQWIDELNGWYAAQILEWERYPTWNATHTFRGGENLQHYVNTGAAYSVVSGRHLERSGMPKQMPQAMTTLLWSQQLHRILVGHTPHGNAPTIVKHRVLQDGSSSPTRDFQVIMCDTSYSDMDAPDMRGQCASMVVVTHQPHGTSTDGHDDDKKEDDVTVWVEGFIHHGPTNVHESYGFNTSEDPFIGRALRTGEWVKTLLAHDRYLVCVVKDSRAYTYSVKSRDEVCEAAVLLVV